MSFVFPFVQKYWSVRVLFSLSKVRTFHQPRSAAQLPLNSSSSSSTGWDRADRGGDGGGATGSAVPPGEAIGVTATPAGGGTIWN